MEMYNFHQALHLTIQQFKVQIYQVKYNATTVELLLWLELLMDIQPLNKQTKQFQMLRQT